MKKISQKEDAHEFIKLSNSWEDRGIRKGLELGVKEAKKEVVIEMLKEGASIAFIMKVTKLDKATIEELQKEFEE